MVDLRVHSTRRRVPALPYKITDLGSKTRYSFLVMAMRLSKNVAKKKRENERNEDIFAGKRKK